MKKALCLLVLLSGFVASANQIIYTNTVEDFAPIKTSTWKLMVGNTSFTGDSSDYKRSGSGLSISAEKNVMSSLSAGAQLGVIRSNTTRYFGYANQDGSAAVDNYKEALTTASAYGKFSFVNYPINKWNLLQVSLLGGLNYIQAVRNNPEFIYGASVSYNYDNMIGFELDSKLDFKAQALTSANLIGYF